MDLKNKLMDTGLLPSPFGPEDAGPAVGSIPEPTPNGEFIA
jgi:hypothetical protein